MLALGITEDINRINVARLTHSEPKLDKTIADKLTVWGMEKHPNPCDVDEVTINGMEMLRIRELQDGDFLAIYNGDFYVIMHSFQEARKIPAERCKKLKTGLYDLSDDELYGFGLEALEVLDLK